MNCVEQYNNIARRNHINVGEEHYARSHTPSPGQRDYERGFILRYFAKKLQSGAGKIVEIDKKQFDSYDSAGSGLKSDIYTVFSLKWKITGPKNDTYNQEGYPVQSGVKDTNERTIESVEDKHPSIGEVLDNPLQFWNQRN